MRFICKIVRVSGFEKGLELHEPLMFPRNSYSGQSDYVAQNPVYTLVRGNCGEPRISLETNNKERNITGS